VIGWLRALLDNGEKAEREAVKAQVKHALEAAQTELKTSQGARLERLADRYDQIKLRPKKR